MDTFGNRMDRTWCGSELSRVLSISRKMLGFLVQVARGRGAEQVCGQSVLIHSGKVESWFPQGVSPPTHLKEVLCPGLLTLPAF